MHVNVFSVCGLLVQLSFLPLDATLVRCMLQQFSHHVCPSITLVNCLITAHHVIGLLHHLVSLTFYISYTKHRVELSTCSPSSGEVLKLLKSRRWNSTCSSRSFSHPLPFLSFPSPPYSVPLVPFSPVRSRRSRPLRSS